jgi:adenine-specific DNA-methyltransferase
LDDYVSEQSAVIDECIRILHPRGSICWQVGSYVNNNEIVPLDIKLYEEFARRGMRLRNRIIWHFEHGLHCTRRFSGRYETILWFTKTDRYHFNLDAVRVPQKYPGKRHYKGPKKGEYSSHPIGKNPGDVWLIPNVKSNHPEKTIHPCQFPIELVLRLILAMSRRGDLVVDPFLGVGTTAAGAVLTGRRVAGAETNGEYLEIAKERVLLASQGRLKYRPLGRPVYQPPANSPLLVRDDLGIDGSAPSTAARTDLGTGLS